MKIVLGFFVKTLWKELNLNIWGKFLILAGIIYAIGNIIIKVFEFSPAVDLVFNVPLIVLGLYLTIRYACKIL